jgi:hypothetical protein
MMDQAERDGREAERRRRIREWFGDEEAERRFAEEAERSRQALAEYREERRREQAREAREAFGDEEEDEEAPWSW